MQTVDTMRMMGTLLGRGLLEDLRKPSTKTAAARTVPRTACDPTLPAFSCDPYPALVKLRERPVHLNERLNVWMLARHGDVVRALKADSVLSSASGVLLRSMPMRTVVTTDNPDHELLRRMISPAFSPSAIRQLAPEVEAFAAPGLDALGGGQVTDVVERLTVPIPVSVIARLLGIEPARWPEFRSYSDELAKFFAIRSLANIGAIARETIPAVTAMRSLLVEHLNRNGEHDDDVLGRFQRAVDDGQLTQADALASAILVLFAGNETTTNLMGIMLLRLAADPDLYDRLREDRDLIPAAVEEAMRWGNPVQWVGRRLVAPFDVDGVTIPARARVVLFLAGANRDPERFANPDEFDLERGGLGHVGFGSGVHTCLGANLTRLELRIALNLLFDRVRRLEIAGQHRWTVTPSLCGPTYLPLRGVAA